MHELSTRFLRGGSGGSGSNYYGGGSYYSGSGSDVYDPTLNFVDILNNLEILVILSLIIIHIATCLKKCGVFGESRNIGSDTGFDQAVCNARLGLGCSQQVNITYGTLVNDATPNFETYEGDFDMIYNDRGTRRSGFLKIQLNSNGVDRYGINGSAHDADGRSTITEGSVLYSGDAWWVEKTFSGADRGLKVLTEGKFDFSTNIFSGTWRANTGIRGHYTYFRGEQVSKTFKSFSNPLRLDDIPVAIAMVETPVVPTSGTDTPPRE